MHGHTLRRESAPIRPVVHFAGPIDSMSGAVTWIDGSRALIARSSSSGGIDIREVRRAGGSPQLNQFLARVVEEIGDRNRVVILGPDAMRVELEREYVTVNRRPDRLVDVEGSDEADELALVQRLEALTAG